MSRYKFIITGDKVICLSRYAGRVVRGIATCSPNDRFDEDFGKKLAQARCDLKVAMKRYSRAMKVKNEAETELYKANEVAERAWGYVWDAEEAFDNATTHLQELLYSESSK